MSRRETVVRCQEEDCDFRVQREDPEEAWEIAETHFDETGHKTFGQIVEIFTIRAPAHVREILERRRDEKAKKKKEPWDPSAGGV